MKAKSKFTLFPDWIKTSVRYGFKDEVFFILFLLIIVIAVVDLFNFQDTTGFIGFLVLPFFVSIAKGGYWKWQAHEYRKKFENLKNGKNEVD